MVGDPGCAPVARRLPGRATGAQPRRCTAPPCWRRSVLALH